MRPFLLALLAALLVGATTFGVFFFRPQVSFSVTPATAKVTVGGSTAEGQSRFVLMPGTYEITIEQDGYIPFKRTERLGIARRLLLTIALKPVPPLKTLVSKPVTLINLSTDKKSILYISDNGKVLIARSDGEEKELTREVFDGPLYFKMSPQQDVAILKKTNAETFIHDFKRYDLVSQEQLFYGRDIGAIDWIYPDGAELLYAYAPGSGERSLIAADRTNKNVERVLNLREIGIFDPTVSVAPDGKTAVLVSRPGDDFAKHNMYLFDLFTKRARQLTTDGKKIDARFTPGGTRILYTRFEQDPDGLNNQLLSVMDVDGKNRKDFNIRTNLDQVDFLSENRLVVAATEKRGDRLYRLDLATGDIEPYYHETLPGVHFNKLVLSGDRGTVYFTGSSNPKVKSGTLYSVKLETDEYE